MRQLGTPCLGRHLRQQLGHDTPQRRVAGSNRGVGLRNGGVEEKITQGVENGRRARAWFSCDTTPQHSRGGRTRSIGRGGGQTRRALL